MGDETPRSAFDDPGTLRAWQRARRRAVAAVILWVLSLPGFLVLEILVWESLTGESLPAYVIAPFVLVSAAGIGLSERRSSHLKQMRGILAVYPWQTHAPLTRVHPGDAGHFQLPDPDSQDKKVSVIAVRYGLGKRWRAALTGARSQGFVFAGDPRFGAVLRPHGGHEFVALRAKHPPLQAGRPGEVHEASWQRAQAAGIAE